MSKPADLNAVTISLERVAAFQRQGTTRFVLLGKVMAAKGGFEPEARTLTIPAEDCSTEVCEALALLQAGDVVSLGYWEAVDVSTTIRKYERVVGASFGSHVPHFPRPQ